MTLYGRLEFELIDANGLVLDLTDKNKFFVENIDGLDHPNVRMRTDRLAGKDGDFLGRQQYSGRAISLDGRFKYFGENVSNTPDQIYANRQEYICHISRFKNPMTLKIIELLDNATTKEYRVICKLKRFNTPTGNNGTISIGWGIDLATEFPFIESFAENSIILNQAFVAPGDTIPDAIGDIIGLFSPTLNTTNNAGCVPAFPILRLTGPQIAPITVSNATTGQTIIINEDLLSGEDIEIDMFKRTAIKNSALNIISKIDGEFFHLDPGDNIMLYLIQPGSIGTTTILWHDAYLGL